MNPFAKCGCDCLHCPAYEENIRTTEERKKCSDGWIIRFSSGEPGQEKENLTTFKKNILKLDKLYGDKAFRMFTRGEKCT